MLRAGLVAAVCLLIAPMMTGAERDAVVLHAEAPADNPLARLAVVQARVRVTVDRDGHVTNAVVLAPPPPFVAGISEEAARKWVFAPSAESREYDLTFFFDGAGETDLTTHQEVAFDDPLTMRVRHYESVIMPPAGAEIALSRERCPVHGVKLSVGPVRLQYGLPRGYDLDDAAGRREYRASQRFGRIQKRLFPKANVFALGGCMVGPAKFVEVAYCPICRRARARWLRQHPSAAQFW